MFDSREEAEAALRAYFDPPLAAAVARALIPAIVIEPIPGAEPVLGGTRLGGTPDLPPDMDWPQPPDCDVEATVHWSYGKFADPLQPGGHPSPDDPDGSMRRSAEEMRRLLALQLPYLFVAQLDLAEASALGPVASPLPPDGRLLFFYDLTLGLQSHPTPAIARVIWDRSPRRDLERRKMPEGLIAAKYVSSARAAALKVTLRLPDISLIEADAVRSILHTSGADGDASYDEAFWDRVDAVRREGWPWHQLLGVPLPVQRDPRYNAISDWELGQPRMPSEERTRRRAEIEARVPHWRLLLQVDLDEIRGYFEGTVYFLIRDVDLEARRFDSVVPIYQTT